MDSVMVVYSALLGLILGSFVNVCIYRIPLKKSIVFPPSSCPNCDEKIRFFVNVAHDIRTPVSLIQLLTEQLTRTHKNSKSIAYFEKQIKPRNISYFFLKAQKQAKVD